MSLLQEIFEEVHAELGERLVFGNRELLDLFLFAFFSRGHLLVEGPPGTGKTFAARMLAEKLTKRFTRIQFTSDMLPADIIGAHLYSPADQEFHFIAGPLFSDFILADEVNRTPPRTQSALLEAMEERQVTVEGKTFPLSRDFFVIATQNPQDLEGTFPLPEAQVDRFLFKVVLSHAAGAELHGILSGVVNGLLPPAQGSVLPLTVDRTAVDAEVARVTIDPSIIAYVASLVEGTRKDERVSEGSSARGGIALLRGARVRALALGRTFVTPDDVKALTLAALRHRIRLLPDALVAGTSEEEVLNDIVHRVSFPGAR